MEQDKLSRLGIKDKPVPTSAETGEEKNGSNDMLHLLENAFFTPMLSLLKVYLMSSNGTKKTTENCILEFRGRHSKVFKFFFSMDFLFRMIYMSVVLLVVIRGLAIDDYLIKVFNLGK